MHAEQGGKARIACGTIKPVASLFVEKSLQYVDGAGFSKYVFEILTAQPGVAYPLY